MVEVLCYFEYKSLIVEKFQDTGAEVRLLDLNRGIGFRTLIRTLRNEIRAIMPDVVHVQYLAPGALPIIAARLAGVSNIIATVHQPYTKGHGRLAKLILRTAAKFTGQFISVSMNVEESWFGSSNLFEEYKRSNVYKKHFTIYNSIDLERIKGIGRNLNHKVLKSALLIPVGIPVIGAISRLRHEKGIDILIDAFNLLIRESSEAHLFIVGSGPDDKMLRKRVHDLGLNSRVTFYGEADWEMAMKLIFVMDIVVVPSRFEGFGLTAGESMAAGRPVVASDTTGLKELVIDGETGILFPVNDISALFHSLHKLIGNNDLRKQLCIAGQKRIKDYFDSVIFERKINTLYSNYLPKSKL
jgi:glycosyltransferase involved in cell wall biosynthesis